MESGKIILKGSFIVTHKKDVKNFFGTIKEKKSTKTCFHTYIFTIKNNKLKVEISDIEYEYKISSYIGSNMYVPIQDIRFTLHSLYPITNIESKYWKENLDMLKQTHMKIEWLINHLDYYIANYKEDYSF